MEEKQERLQHVVGALLASGMSVEDAMQEAYAVALTLVKVDGLTENYRLELAEQASKMVLDISNNLEVSARHQQMARQQEAIASVRRVR